MKKKYDAWAIVRLDAEAVSMKDYISVKGVYDSEAFATKALEDLLPQADTEYVTLRTRRFAEEPSHQEVEETKERIQGIYRKRPQVEVGCYHESVSIIRDFWTHFSDQVQKNAILPFLNKTTERAVAKSLGGETVAGTAPWDICLPNGEKIEVKTVLLDESRKKAPILTMPSYEFFDYLALVVYFPDFSIADSCLIPSISLKDFSRLIGATREYQMINVRVTEHLLHAPGVTHLWID